MCRPLLPPSDDSANAEASIFNSTTTADHWFASARTLAAAVVDGVGNDLEITGVVHLLAETAVRVGARKGALAGLMAASELIANTGVEFPVPDGSMVLAVCRPLKSTLIAQVGDTSAFGYYPRYTPGLVPLAEGDFAVRCVRPDGEHDPESHTAGCRVTTGSVARATMGTVTLTETHANTVVLTSRGVHGHLSIEDMTQVVNDHRADPAKCAALLVEAAREAGNRDNATALVLTHEESPIEHN